MPTPAPTGPAEAAQRIAVSGSTGLVGRALTDALVHAGHTVHPLVRRAPRPESHEIQWDPHAGIATPTRLEGLDAVIHLAGAPIAAGRWTKRVKADIAKSRSEGTRHLADVLATLDRPPKALLCASAIGYYGDRGDEDLTETSAPGTGYLADVCRAWEAAADPARDAGIRTAHLRTGIILARHGGALKKMLLPFRLGLGGPIGRGRQHFSWITLDDTVGAYLHTLQDKTIQGPVNVTAPNPVTNAEFTKALGAVLRRPTVFPIPPMMLRAMYGEMADALLLSSAKVHPRVLEQSGHRFQHREILVGLGAVLGNGR